MPIKQKDTSFDDPVDDRLVKKKKEEYKLPLKMSKSVWGGQRIDVPYFKDVKNEYPLPDGPILGVIVGSSGTGKTTLLLSLIPCIGNLSQIVVASKVIGNPSNIAIEAYCQHRGLKYAFGSEPEEVIENIESMIKTKKDGTYCLVIFDDWSNANIQSRSDPYNQVMIKTGQILRNYDCHSICISQSYTGIPTLLRNNARFIVTFKMSSRISINFARADWCHLTGHSEEVFNQLYKRLGGDRHSYLLSTEKKVYIYEPNVDDQLHEVEIHDDEED